MRQRMSEKNVLKIREQTGLPVVLVTVRGGDNHVKDLYLEGGKMVYLNPDGTIQESTLKWDWEKWNERT